MGSSNSFTNVTTIDSKEEKSIEIISPIDINMLNSSSDSVSKAEKLHSQTSLTSLIQRDRDLGTIIEKLDTLNEIDSHKINSSSKNSKFIKREIIDCLTQSVTLSIE